MTPDPDRIAQLHDLVEYHSPSPEQVAKMAEIRNATHCLIVMIDTFCPPSADRTHAVRCVRDAMMTANRSIVLNGADYR
jgi:hypothetical protein